MRQGRTQGVELTSVGDVGLDMECEASIVGSDHSMGVVVLEGGLF